TIKIKQFSTNKTQQVTNHEPTLDILSESIFKGREQGVERWMIYQEIHRLKNIGFSNSKIAKQLKISRNRVIDYKNTTPHQFADFIVSLQNRTQQHDTHQHEILPRLKAYPDATSAKVYDSLQDQCDVHSVSENTVRNNVSHLRQHYHIPKVTPSRI